MKRETKGLYGRKGSGDPGGATGKPNVKSGCGAGQEMPTGIVDYYVRGDDERHSVVSDRVMESMAPDNLVQVIQTGLPVRELEDLQARLDVPMERLAASLGISKATLHRRKKRGTLDAAESDRVVRFARLMGKAVGVMESTENARRWLTAPQIGLGGAVPLVYAETEVGAREVEDLLGRIEYGVYS